MMRAHAKSSSAVFAVLVFSDSGGPLHNLIPTTAGSINAVGGLFQSFRINLELVAQICPRWNPMTSWMRHIEAFQATA
jgi:hypothetical protein